MKKIFSFTLIAVVSLFIMLVAPSAHSKQVKPVVVAIEYHYDIPGSNESGIGYALGYLRPVGGPNLEYCNGRIDYMMGRYGWGED